jgi:Fe-S oxidoreductase
MDPATTTVFGIPGTAIFWVAVLAAFGLFGRRIWTIVRLLRRARPDDRFGQLATRLRMAVVHVLAQPRMLREWPIGPAHLLIFWSFVLFAAFSVLGLAAIVVAALRRRFFPPPHLQRTRDANIILVLIALVLGTTVFGMAFKAVSMSPSEAGLHAVDRFMAAVTPAMPAPTAELLYVIMFWLHQLVVLGFLAYLPYSKHAHLLASPFNVFFGPVRPPGDLNVPGSADDRMAGAATWKEFTWKQLLNSLSCAECGRCDRACPAVSSGSNFSPRSMVHAVKDHLLTVGMKELAAPKGNGHAPQPLIGGAIPEADVWACATCGACMDRCPVLGEHVSMVVSMRRGLVGQGAVSPQIEDVLQKLNRYGNTFGQSERNRARWAQGLDFPIKDARKEPVEFLWFVGDVASFDARLTQATQNTARIFRKAGVDFGILFEAERNSGNDARRIGEEGLFDLLREKNREAMSKAKFTAIVTTDPHTYNTLRNEYEFPVNGHGTNGSIRVLHYTELLDRLFAQGRLSVVHPLRTVVTYHDACYLGRYNDVYDAPRRVLRAIGTTLKEMPRTRSESFCCGAGGGRIWMEDAPGTKERPSESRVREAAALDGVASLVVACPKDMAMFQDAVKTTGLESTLTVRELSELVWDAVRD